MENNNVLLIFLAAGLSLGLVYFQYYFKGRQQGKTRMLLSFLRFLGIFGILLLLINPKFSKTTYRIEKPNLVVLVDNSSSMQGNREVVAKLVGDFQTNPDLSGRFNIASYLLGEKLRVLDSLTFTDALTNIQKPLATLKEVYARKNTAVVLVSDGNQNIGQDYSLSNNQSSPEIYSITVGDTTRFEDLGVGPINTNKYAFLNNKYPVESYVNYQGDGTVDVKVAVTVDGEAVLQEVVTLSKANNLKNINTLVDAKTVGVKAIQVRVSPLDTERNTANNSRTASVEVISEKTKIGLVSQLLHPDIGTLKKAIESNEQREVVVLKPGANIKVLEDMDFFILYQPTRAFQSVFDFIDQKRSNHLIVTGTHTDFQFLNSAQKGFTVETGYPVQEVFATLNTGFSKFDILDLDLTDFPPLNSKAGPIVFNEAQETLLGLQIKGLDMDLPLLSVYGSNTSKKAILSGEGIWKWRMQSYRNSGDFVNMDAFLGKLMRYLAADTARNRLNLTYSRNYEGSNTVYISATYFDETYVFDPNAAISITVSNRETKAVNTVPMVLKNGYFEADLTNLLPGDYEFTASVKGAGHEERGRFTILDFDLEKQFVSSNYLKMQALASNTGGKHFFPSGYPALLSELISSNSYVPAQKSSENVVSLIDFRILLGLIVLALSLEWFIRKYNGLI